jgi:hypothetical protein
MLIRSVWISATKTASFHLLPLTEFKGLTVEDVLELERVEIMPIPSAFDGYFERTGRGSSTCLVSVARNRYSVPC